MAKAVSDRTIRCCYSLNSSADDIIAVLSSLQFESITPFARSDKDTPLDSVRNFLKIRSNIRTQTRQLM